MLLAIHHVMLREGEDKCMFLYNIVDKVYISRINNLFPDDNRKIVISENSPNTFYDDIYNVICSSSSLDQFLLEIEKDESSLKKIFEKNNNKLVIYASDDEFPKLYMYFTLHLQKAFNLTDDDCDIILSKTSERYFSETFDLTTDMNKFIYLDFKSRYDIDDNDLIYNHNRPTSLPVEVLYFMYYKDIIKGFEVKDKIKNLSHRIYHKFFNSVAQIGFTLVSANPKILDSYFQKSINTDVMSTIQSDAFLSSIFTSVGNKPKKFFTSNKAAIGRLVHAIGEGSKAYDYISEGDTIVKEYNRINCIFKPDGYLEFLNHSSQNFFGELMFTEDGDKVNIMLIKYIANLSKNKKGIYD